MQADPPTYSVFYGTSKADCGFHIQPPFLAPRLDSLSALELPDDPSAGLDDVFLARSGLVVESVVNISILFRRVV